MGCGITKEKIESEILMLQLTRSEIKQERSEIIEKYQEITGKKLRRPKIPDYIDHQAMKRKKSRIKQRTKESDSEESSSD